MAIHHESRHIYPSPGGPCPIVWGAYKHRLLDKETVDTLVYTYPNRLLFEINCGTVNLPKRKHGARVARAKRALVASDEKRLRAVRAIITKHRAVIRQNGQLAVLRCRDSGTGRYDSHRSASTSSPPTRLVERPESSSSASRPLVVAMDRQCFGSCCRWVPLSRTVSMILPMLTSLPAAPDQFLRRCQYVRSSKAVDRLTYLPRQRSLWSNLLNQAGRQEVCLHHN
jgi:hypothetical protein